VTRSSSSAFFTSGDHALVPLTFHHHRNGYFRRDSIQEVPVSIDSNAKMEATSKKRKVDANARDDRDNKKAKVCCFFLKKNRPSLDLTTSVLVLQV
jgi:hypothetical protein